MTDVTRRRLLAGIGGGTAVLAAGLISRLRSPGTRPPSTNPTSNRTTTTAGTVTTSTMTTVSTTTTSPARALEVVCREAWGSAEPAGTFTRHTIDRLTLHHTAVRLDSNADAPARARAHQAFHQDSGFVDLAYHFVVDLEGNVLEGRPVEYVGDTFTEYDPTGHMLVCCEGDYNEQHPTTAQLSAVADLFAWGCVTFHVEPATLAGHRDHAASTCPGDNLYAPLADGSLRTAIETAIARGVERHDICGPAAEQRVDAISSEA